MQRRALLQNKDAILKLDRKQETTMDERIEIATPETASIFANERSRLILLALIDRARSPADLAALTGARLNLLSYHLKRMVALGLATVEREAPRAGRPVRYYRAAAKSFFVPAHLAGSLPGRDKTAQLQAALERSFAGSYTGILYLHEHGPRMRIVPVEGGTRSAADLWHHCTLTPADARAFARDLAELFDRYARLDRPNGRRYIVHAALAPE
jgi:DNA-binding transcriptional ArsR family regulator